MWPHRWQPTRLHRPWDSPGKNTGVGCHFLLQCMKVKRESEVAQSCPTLHDPMDCSLSGPCVHGIFQARVLEWGASSFSNAWKWTVKVKSLSRVRLLATPWTAAYQAPVSMGFSRQEYWSGCHRLLRWTTNWDTKYLMGHVMLSIQTKLICNHITDSYMEWSNKQCSI